MSDLLFLAHRIPFPPNKGDKIRSFNILRHLSGPFRIHLGAFVDDPDDWRYRDEVAAYCASLCLLPLNPRLAKLRSLSGLVSGEALTLPYYRDRRMHRWVRETLAASGPMPVLVFSSAMAQYLPSLTVPDQASDSAPERLPQVVDFVDVDSDKWRQYAQGHGGPMRWIYAREARRLLAFERAVAARASASVLVSEQEAILFRQLLQNQAVGQDLSRGQGHDEDWPQSQTPEAALDVAARVHAIDNGVDTDYFSPERDYPNPYPPGSANLVFTGAMDYWANVDAVSFFADAVFPRIRQAMPEARFVIVGSRPMPAVQALGERPGIEVTGSVPDVRPYLAHAQGAVAPLRIARGVQNKVLEAMAMGCPVAATPQALDGLRDCAGMDWLVAEGAEPLAALALRLLSADLRDQREQREQMGRQGRACVLQHYSWSEHLDRLVRLLQAEPSLMGAKS
ncbi:glycosyltransferase [Lamprobacter sp.]|uniref:glycosyltransferase n=1 Tax=Lamprobacter sp. TaxID=3100796 RepID=UPI003A4E519A